MKYIVNVNCGGNHGHKLRNYISTYIISSLFKIKYLHINESITDSYGVGYGEELCDFKYIQDSVPYILGNWSEIGTEPNWKGDVRQKDIDAFLSVIDKDMFIAARNYVFFPHTVKQLIDEQKIPFQDFNLFFDNISKTLTEKYNIVNTSLNTTPIFNKEIVNIAIHINRGSDVCPATSVRATNSDLERFQFKLEYFENIIQQISSFLDKKNKKYKFFIYTEQLNSEEIVTFFSNKEHIQLCIGCNRGTRTTQDLKLISEIFHSFTQCDILVTCNSSFSMTSTFLRYKKPFIFKEHTPFRIMPYDWALSTDEQGNFNVDKLNEYII